VAVAAARAKRNRLSEEQVPSNVCDVLSETASSKVSLGS
jgi:hypothetical protein